MSGSYTVVVDGKKYSVQVAEGNVDIQISQSSTTVAAAPVKEVVAAVATPTGAGSIEINSQTPGNVWKIVLNPGDKVKEGDKIMILEAMKMEIDIAAPQDGVIKSINVNVNDSVHDGQLLATME